MSMLTEMVNHPETVRARAFLRHWDHQGVIAQDGFIDWDDDDEVAD